MIRRWLAPRQEWQREQRQAEAQPKPKGGGFSHAPRFAECVLSTTHRPRLSQELLDHLLGLVVAALADLDVPDAAAGIHEVGGRPVAVAIGVPCDEFVVLRHRVADPVLRNRIFDVLRISLIRELGCVHADHH